MGKYKIKSGDIEQINKLFASHVDVLKGVGETIGSPDEIEVHLEPIIECFNEMREIAAWFKDGNGKPVDKENPKKKRNSGELIYALEEELNHRINLFLEEARMKKRSLDDIVILFNPVQKELNKLTEQADYLEGKVEEIESELDFMTDEAKKSNSAFDQSLELKGCTIRVTAGGSLSMANQDTLERMLRAIEEDEILCNQNVNAFL